MSLNLTNEELNLVRRFASESRHSRRTSFFISILIAPLVFAFFGLFKVDYVSIAIAFFGLLAITLWLIVGSTQNGKLIASIAVKILEDNPHSGACHESDPKALT